MNAPTISSILESCGRLDCLPIFEEQEISIEQLPSLGLEDQPCEPPFIIYRLDYVQM
jgi:hypothetical protein